MAGAVDDSNINTVMVIIIIIIIIIIITMLGDIVSVQSSRLNLSHTVSTIHTCYTLHVS